MRIEMTQWVAFALLLGIPAWWFFVGNGPAKTAEDIEGHGVGYFRLATAEVEIPAGPDAFDKVEAALQEFWSRHQQVSPTVQMEIGIAAAELAGNILEHGTAETFRMRINLSPCQVHVDFIDDGGPVEIDLGSVEMPGEFAETGRGLAMVKASMSRLSYQRDRLVNRWTFVSKEFDRTKSAQSTQG